MYFIESKYSGARVKKIIIIVRFGGEFDDCGPATRSRNRNAYIEEKKEKEFIRTLIRKVAIDYNPTASANGGGVFVWSYVLEKACSEW